MQKRYSILKTEEAGSIETPVNFCQTALRCVPVDSILLSGRKEAIQFHIKQGDFFPLPVCVCVCVFVCVCARARVFRRLGCCEE
jgi:hypothetical protein